MVGVLPLPQTCRCCSANSLLDPAYLNDSATWLLEGEDSAVQLSDAVSQTVVPCEL